MSDGPALEEESDPAEVFAALSDPVRVAVLQALWDAPDHEASFSELREAVDVQDSGRFNYHLSKLRDRFVTSEDGTYRLRLAGRRIVGALLSGAYTREASADPVPIEFECPMCSGPTAVRYADEHARVECTECEHAPMQLQMPPGVFQGYPAERFPDVIDRYGRMLLDQGRAGFCVNCEGPVDATVEPLGAVFGIADDDDLATLPFVEYECRRCGETITADVGNALIEHPAVVAFHHDHGVDVRELRTWEVLTVDPDRARFVSEDPVRIEVEFAVGDARLTVTADGSLEVLETDRADPPA